jgi:perosamine synthetase
MSYKNLSRRTSLRIPISRPDIKFREKLYTFLAVNSTWVSSLGPYINKTEFELEEFTKKKHNILTSNGTTALHLALLSLDVKGSDEVIVPSLTFIAPVNAVKYVGATPVFADIKITSLGMDPLNIKNLVSSKTKAIIYVHLYGIPNDLRNLKEFCIQKGIYLIEDCAECFDGSISGIKAGETADISTFSFYGNKIITSGEGGAVCTNNEEIAKKIRTLKNHGMSANKKYYFEIIGFNFRMTNISAALLYAQLKRFNKMKLKRLIMYKKYNELLDNFKNFRTFNVDKNINISPWLFPLICPSEKIRDSIIHDLRVCGIETRPFFIPIHTLPIYSEYNDLTNLENSINISKVGLSLPTSSDFNYFEIKYIIRILYKILQKYE